MAVGHQQAGRQRAPEDREKGAGLDQGIAADEFFAAQHLRQQAVFRGREEGRVQAHQEKAGQQHQEIALRKAPAGQRHDRDLSGLDDLQDQRLVIAVRELACETREQQKGQDEQPAGEIGEQFGCDLRLKPGAERRQQHEPILQQVVIERAERLAGEVRQEAPFGEQPELTGCARHET